VPNPSRAAERDPRRTCQRPRLRVRIGLMLKEARLRCHFIAAREWPLFGSRHYRRSDRRPSQYPRGCT
jgi:hypothetical protein